MKKLAGFLFIVLLIYSVYHDMNYGTLPTAVSPVETEEKEPSPTDKSDKTDSPYFEKKIQPGDTVLSVLEKRFDGPLPVPISTIIKDFHSLNNGMDPKEIQLGKSYKFPEYSETE